MLQPENVLSGKIDETQQLPRIQRIFRVRRPPQPLIRLYRYSRRRPRQQLQARPAISLVRHPCPQTQDAHKLAQTEASAKRFAMQRASAAGRAMLQPENVLSGKINNKS